MPLAKLELVFHLGQLLVILIVVGTMTANYKTGNAETQRKIYWLLTGAFIFLIARVISLTVQVLLEWLGLTTIHIGPDAQPFYVVGMIRTAVWSAANIGLLACVFAAVFYTGVIDPRLVLKRTAVYSSGFGVLLFIFAVFVNYVSEVIAEMLQITEGLIEAIAGALVAVAFKPVHDWLSKLAERILPSRSTHKSELEAAA